MRAADDDLGGKDVGGKAGRWWQWCACVQPDRSAIGRQKEIVDRAAGGRIVKEADGCLRSVATQGVLVEMTPTAIVSVRGTRRH